MIRTQIHLTKDQAKALKCLAKERRVSVAELVRQGVDMLLRNTGAPDPEEQRRRALDIVGRFRSGRGDLAAKHDRHFAEAQEK